MTKQKKEKEKFSYVFPNVLAKAMSKVDMRAQLEASMLSQFLLLIGLSAMVLYIIFTRQTSGFYKFMIIFNLLCGWVLISSFLITTYQQYTSYGEAMGFDPKAEKAAVKKKGNIFKRIMLAIKNKKKSKGLTPNFVEDALKNMEKAEGTQRSLEEIPKEDIKLKENVNTI